MVWFSFIFAPRLVIGNLLFFCKKMFYNMAGKHKALYNKDRPTFAKNKINVV